MSDRAPLRWPSGLVLLVLVLVAAWQGMRLVHFRSIGSPPGQAEIKELEVGETLPDLEFQHLGSVDSRLSSAVVGKCTVIVLWEPSCPYCASLAADLGREPSIDGLPVFWLSLPATLSLIHI